MRALPPCAHVIKQWSIAGNNMRSQEINQGDPDEILTFDGKIGHIIFPISIKILIFSLIKRQSLCQNSIPRNVIRFSNRIGYCSEMRDFRFLRKIK